MKMIFFYATVFAFISAANAQETPMNAANVLMSMKAVTKPPSSGWFILVADDKAVEGLKLKPIESFKVIHNPETDRLTVSQPSDKAEAGEWQLFDANDKLRWSQKVTENDIESSINIQSLTEGIYFVSFSVDGQRRFTQKFVKIKSN